MAIGMRATTTQDSDALAFINSVLSIGSAAAQRARPREFVTDPQTFLTSCPPGHRIQFQAEGMSLYVDPHWLETYSLQQLAEHYRNSCPTEPVQVGQGLVNPLFFNRSIIAAAGTPTNLGSSYLRLIIGFVSRREDKPFPGADGGPVQQPLIVDVTPRVLGRNNPRPGNRIYELRYPDDGTESSTTVRVPCSGGGPETRGKRSCFTVSSYDAPYRYRGVLSVYYRISHSPSTETGMSEPEAILAFDMRVRAWVDRMMIKP